jgi:hypothetical protein
MQIVSLIAPLIAPLIISAVISSAVSSSASADSLLTTADQTHFKKTGRYDEVIRLCDAFQKTYPKQVRCFDFGFTPEGRPMKALAVSSAGHLNATSARAAGDPVLLIQGGIHAGEIDGKDAGFWWIREALEKKKEALNHVTIVFVPVFNIDGHERFAAFNRPNQVGPEEMGWRVTSWNLNLNRDYTKADTPEMQSMLRLMNDWDPIVYTDLHVTDGAKFQHAISVGFLPNHLSLKAPGMPAGNRKLIELASELEKNVKTYLDDKGYMALTLYPDFVRRDDPASGFEEAFSHPRFSHGYANTRNRIGLLVETHSWKDYATRVHSTYDTIEALVNSAARDGKSWVQAAKTADEAMTKSAPSSKLALRYEASKKSHPIDFQGYAYKIEDSEISNQKRIVYDETKKQVWTVPLFDDLQPSLTVTLPKGGYIVEASQAEWMSKKLQLHGIRYEVLKKPLVKSELETFRSDSPDFSAKPNEGRQTLKVTGDWKKEKRDVIAGALYIPVGQPHAVLLANLLEPLSDESFLSWGFFNAFFERKEYMEDYVAEDVARDMLKDATTRAEFETQLKDKEFAKDSHKRLEFFYRKHSSWDDRLGLYPIYRIGKSPL